MLKWKRITALGMALLLTLSIQLPVYAEEMDDPSLPPPELITEAEPPVLVTEPESVPEPEPEPEPEPAPQPEPEPELPVVEPEAVVEATPEPVVEATPEPVVEGSTPETAIAVEVGGDMDGEITGTLHTLYFHLEAQEDAVLTLSADGLSVCVDVTDEHTGASESFAPEQDENGDNLPLEATFGAANGHAYLFAVCAAEDGEIGAFRVELRKASEPETSGPSDIAQDEPEEDEPPVLVEEAEDVVEAVPAPQEPVQPDSEPAVSPEPTADPALDAMPAEDDPLVVARGFNDIAIDHDPVLIEDIPADPDAPVKPGEDADSRVTTESYICYTVAGLQSNHNYSNNTDYRYRFSVPGATSITLTFSANTYVESGWDYISIYSVNASNQATQVGSSYTGSQLAGRTVTVSGNTVLVRLETDGSNTSYGFTVTHIQTSNYSTNTIAPRAQVGNATVGSAVEAGVNQYAGYPMQSYTWRLHNSAATVVAENTSASSVEHFRISASGTYVFSTVGYDGYNYSNTVYSNWFAVTSNEPTRISVQTNGNNFNVGETIAIQATQLSGQPIQMYRFIISDSNGYQIGVYDSGNNYIYYTTPSYECMLIATVLAYDGSTWVSAMSDWFRVSAYVLPQISVSLSAGTVAGGAPVTISVSQLAGKPLQMYHFIISDSYGNPITVYDTGANSFTYQTPNYACTLIATVQAYDGTNWCMAYSNWFGVYPSTQPQLSVSLSGSSFHSGDWVAVSATQTAGNPLRMYHFVVMDSNGGQIAVYDTGSSTISFQVPAYDCTLIVMVQAYDGANWCMAYSDWFSVTHPVTPLSVYLSGSSFSSSEQMIIGTVQNGGSPFVMYRYTIYDNNGAQVSVIDTTASSIYYVVPSYSCTLVAYVQAYDGVNWYSAYSDWFTVTGSNRRALIIGNTYTGTSNALVGPGNDSSAMVSMLNNMNASNYTATRRTELSASGIQSAISSTFSGATANDVSLFYYSGHGTSDGSLVGSDLRSYISPSNLRSYLDRVPGKKIVIIDACHSGYMIGKDGEMVVMAEETLTKSEIQARAEEFVDAFMEGFSGGSRANLAASDYYVLCACAGNQLSWESRGYGYFTSALTGGCGWNERTSTRIETLSADSNYDKQISHNELYNYLRSHYDGTATSQGSVYYYNVQAYPTNSSFILFGRQ